jgi:SAM-dependent methyltransferase
MTVLEGLAGKGHRLMDDDARFAGDLYRGTAGYYDRCRLPYPEAMIGDLVRRARLSGQGRLLDLACGTGQLTFPLRGHFAEAWAVDREPGMVEAVRAKARAAGAGNVRAVAADAEALDAPPGHFELAVIGNAFHRLRRDTVARRLLGWLRPGGCVALCWSDGPEAGGEQWQQALAAFLGTWRRTLGAADRVPANWAEPRRRRPDHQVLAEAGFEVAGCREFTVGHRWSLPELAGYVRSTSVLPPAVLGGQGDAFDAGLAAALGPLADGGTFRQAVSFACELARRPA